MRPTIRRLARPATALGTLAIVLSGLFFVGRSPDPRLADPAADAARSEALRRAGSAAAAALERLYVALEAALADGRAGTAATVSGDADPAPALLHAAAGIDASRVPAIAAVEALDRLSGLLRAGGVVLQPLDVSPGQLATIAGQFRGAASPAELAAIRAWKADLVTLPLWIATAGRLLTALRAGSAALIAGDAGALAKARLEFAAAAVEARRADLALGIAIAEGGSSIADPALRGLAEALGEVQRSGDAVASVMRGVGER